MEEKCPKCRSHKHVVGYGVRHNRSGDKQKYRCNACWCYFIKKDAFFKKKYPREIIVEACSLYKRGMGFKEAADHLNEYKGTTIVPSSVFYWVTHYSKILKKME